MKHAPLTVALLVLLSTGCNPSSSDPGDASTKAPTSPTSDTTGTSATTPTEPNDPTGTGNQPVTTTDEYVPLDPSNFGRGLAYVRTHPMMVSGLVTMMGPPSVDVVDTYYDDFGANTLHLWQSGLADELNGWLAHRPDQPWISWVLDNGNGWNGQLIGGITPSAGRIGYQVGDEPANMAVMLELQPGIDAVRAADPGALVFINHGPDFVEDLEAMVEASITTMGVDIASHDMYTMNYGQYDRMEISRRVALANGVPYWRYLSSYEYEGETDWLTETDMRWHALLGLVYGYTGHSWFLYQIADGQNLQTSLFGATGTWNTAPNDRFWYASDINNELHNLGQAITLLTSTDVRFIPSLLLNQPNETSNWAPGAGGDPYITSIAQLNPAQLDFVDIPVGFFEDDYGEVYVMVQNGNHESASWPLYYGAAIDFRVVFDFSNVPAGFDRTVVQSLNPRTGVVENLPLVALGGQQAALDLSLGGGAVVLFKYATGEPFALQP